MLYHAAFNDAKKERKEAPLFTESGIDGAPTLRIRALQHMTIIHLQRRLAILAEDIISTRTATETQMDRVQEVLKDYGKTMVASTFLIFGCPIDIQMSVGALRDLKYMLEAPSQNPKVAKHLQDLLYLNASNANDLAIMMDANLIKDYPLQSKPRLHVSN